MAKYSLLMPKMGESVIEATVLSWLKKTGDSISEQEVLLEVATDKVDTDVPSPVSGTILEIRFQEGDVVPVGEVLAIIETDSALADEAEEETPEEAPAKPETEAPAEPQPEAETEEAPAKKEEAEDDPETQTKPESKPEPKAESKSEEAAPEKPAPAPPPAAPKTEGRYYSPLVLNIAQTEGIPLAELEQVPGTGLDGRITKDDILQYIAARPGQAAKTPDAAPAAPAEKPKPASVAATPPPAVTRGGEDEIIEMDRMRKLISKNMLSSLQTSAHVSSIIEADLTNLVQWREKQKKAFQQREGFNFTYMPVIVEAIVKAIKDFPMINVSVEGEKIIRKHNINIGIATALPSGNLIVPVVKNADLLSLGGLAAAINALVLKARSNSLTVEDIEGGTYTITNIGSFGTLIGTAIIPQPQVAIMAVGSITKKPVVLETKEGDVIAIRNMMYLSHTYDHRVVDGMLGGQFVKRVAEYLEQFDVSREV
jgi:2-oxoglutarate dehydrogenase E2 component (dihydrolipoamide succinyltransferase)